MRDSDFISTECEPMSDRARRFPVFRCSAQRVRRLLPISPTPSLRAVIGSTVLRAGKSGTAARFVPLWDDPVPDRLGEPYPESCMR